MGFSIIDYVILVGYTLLIIHHELLIEECISILGVEREDIVTSMNHLENEKHIVAEKTTEKAVYLSPFYYAEVGISTKMKSLINQPKQMR